MNDDWATQLAGAGWLVPAVNDDWATQLAGAGLVALLVDEFD